MFALGQDVEDDIEREKEKAELIKNVAEFRDELFEGNKGMTLKIIIATVIGSYIIYRFLIK